MIRPKVVVCLWCAFVGTTAFAYDQETHRILSEQATLASILGDDKTRAILGFGGLITGNGKTYLNSKGDPRTIQNLIMDGARFEDDGQRSLNHFFNPRTGQPLFVDPNIFTTFDDSLSAASVAAMNALAATSPDWALGRTAGGHETTNIYTWENARQWYVQSAVNPSDTARRNVIGLLFETLGRLMHHMQDMAQPQHVRNDLHLQDDGYDENCFPFMDPLLHPFCQAYLRLRAPSIYESWTLSLGANIPTSGYPPVYGPSSDGLGTFDEPKRFWSYSGKGIADFTNRNFLSAGTMGIRPPVVDEVGFDIKASDLCNGVVPGCEVVDLDHLVHFYASTVDDQFRNGAGGDNPYAASSSIYEPEFRELTIDHRPLYTVNRFTFLYDHAYLLPRAVGFSAGLVNYFFRGSMEVSAPDEGIYGILDHSPSGCGSPCGFRTLKLKIKNVTPGNGQFHEEPMGDDVGASNLWAVVKYHLNACYQPDLSGEDGGNHFNGNSCRSANEYVSVSAPHPVQIVSADQPQQIVFDFSGKPIPINASDIFLQVVFRGRLGMEDDAVAVATKDISEPTYYGLENVTDYAYDENGDQKYHPVASDASMVDVTDVHIAFGPNADKAEPVASLALLAGGQHAQIAVLMDTGPQQASISLSGEFGQAPAVVQFDPAEFTEDDEGAAAGLYQRNCDLVLRRGLYRERGVLFVQRTHGIVGGIHILDNQTSSAAAAELPVTSERHGVRTESVRDPRCTHLTTGMYDLSSMTPFVPEAAQSWTIRF